MWNDTFKLDSPLHKIARRYLCIVGTSVSSEIMSKAGDKITAEKSRLLGTNASKLLFMASFPKNMWINFCLKYNCHYLFFILRFLSL